MNSLPPSPTLESQLSEIRAFKLQIFEGLTEEEQVSAEEVAKRASEAVGKMVTALLQAGIIKRPVLVTKAATALMLKAWTLAGEEEALP